MEAQGDTHSLDSANSTDELGPLPIQSKGRAKRWWFYPMLASWNGGANMVLNATTNVIWPAQISAILQEKSKEDLYNGIIPAPGVILSVFVGPLAGVLSDYVQLKFGRRKIFILVGSLVLIASLLCMAPLTTGNPKNVFALLGIICLYNAGYSAAGIPHLSLIRDVVGIDKTGLASGWIGAAAAIGSIVGSIGAGLLVDYGKETNFWPAYIFAIAGFIAFALPTLLGIFEPPLPRNLLSPFHSLSHLLHSFYLPFSLYKNFYFMWATRASFSMGVYSFVPFLQYFFEDVLNVSNAATLSSVALAVLIVTSIPATIISGYFSDKYGRKLMIYISALIMMIGSALVGALSYAPNLIAIFILAAVIGLGYGTYLAVDYAMTVDVLPPNSRVARDMGIWQLSVIVPSAIAPAIAGAILSTVKNSHGNAAGYCTLLFIVAAWFALSILFVLPVRPPPKPASLTTSTDLIPL